MDDTDNGGKQPTPDRKGLNKTLGRLFQRLHAQPTIPHQANTKYDDMSHADLKIFILNSIQRRQFYSLKQLANDYKYLKHRLPSSYKYCSTGAHKSKMMYVQLQS